MAYIEVFRAPGFAVDVDPTAVTIRFAVPATNIGGPQIRLRRDGELAEFLDLLLAASSARTGDVRWREITICCDRNTYLFAHAGDAYTFSVIVETELVISLRQDLQRLLDKKGEQA